MPQETQVSQLGLGLGVSLNNIVRRVDMNVLKDIFTQSSRTEQFKTRESYLERIQQFHGPSEAESAISAELSRLNDAFAALSVSPEDPALLNTTVNQARSTAAKFNDFSDLITQLRNEAQEELKSVVTETNNLLRDVQDLNEQINRTSASGRSVANLLDQRDQVMRKLSQNIDISYFPAENDTIVVLDKSGKTLVDSSARNLEFNPTPLGPESSLGNGGSATITITGNNSAENADITQQKMGGRMEALLTLRDETLVQYQAQVDELAQKTSTRFAEQGLTMFVDGAGNVPATTTPPAPVTYTGYAGQMQVNPQILEDPTLLRQGTAPGGSVLPASNEIIDRVLEYTFGANRYTQATGKVDISSGSLFAATGLEQSAQVIGNRDITDYVPLTDHPDIADGMSFDLDVGGGAVSITINNGDSATDLVNKINTAAGAGSARLNGLGQLVLEANADITFSDNTLGAAGADALGLSFGTTTAESPQFAIQVGTQSPVTITIEPGDTQANLMADLNAVPGITASLDANGYLQINSLDANGVNNGKLVLTNGRGNPVAALGMETGAVRHEAFRSSNLGVDGNVKTGLTGAPSIEKLSRSMVAFHAEEHSASVDRVQREETFYNTLNESFLNETGVDIDQEMSDLIRFQTSYTAMTQIIQAAEKQFDDLINAIR